MARQSANEDEGLEEKSPVSETAKTLGLNLSALMGWRSELSSNPKVAKKTGFSTATISRLRHGEVNANLDTLERLAAAFEVDAWQLLVRGFDPKNPPALQPLSERERQLYAKWRESLKEFIKEGG